MAVQTQIQTRRGTAASWTSTNPTLAAGEIGFETDTGKFKIGNGSTAWASLAYSAGATAVTYLFNATGGQTTFSGADANGLTLAYTVGAEQVYLNGVLQVRGSDYTATNGTSIVLASGALVSDVLNVIAYSAMTITDTYTQAQADAKFFQNANAFVAGKNKIINGDFGINQRSFTSSTTSGIYTFDRWLTQFVDGTSTCSAETFTVGTAPVAGYESINFLRLVSTGQTAASSQTRIQQLIEDVRTFAGQTVTVSFWAKASTGTPNVAINLQQNFGSGGSTAVEVTGQKFAITSSWVRYSKTFSIPSISGKTIGTSNLLRLNLWTSAGTDFAVRTDSLGIQSVTIDFWGVQVEAGSNLTAFQTATGTIQGELAACQRYYYRVTAAAIGNRAGSGFNGTTTLANVIVPFMQQMRTAPSTIETTGTAADYSVNSPAGNIAASAVPAYGVSDEEQAVMQVSVASGLTAGDGCMLRFATAGAYLGFSAEL